MFNICLRVIEAVAYAENIAHGRVGAIGTDDQSTVHGRQSTVDRWLYSVDKFGIR